MTILNSAIGRKKFNKLLTSFIFGCGVTVLFFLMSCCSCAQTTVTFTVDQPAAPTQIDAGEDQVFDGEGQVFLGGTPSFSGGYGDFYSYNWEVIEPFVDAELFLSGTNIANPEVIFLDQERTFQFVAIDVLPDLSFCVKVDSVTVSFPLSTDEKHGITVKLYPNPFNDLVALSTSEGITHIDVFDLSGRLMKQVDANHVMHFQFSSSDLPNGFYFFQIHFGNEQIKTIKGWKR